MATPGFIHPYTLYNTSPSAEPSKGKKEDMNKPPKPTTRAETESTVVEEIDNIYDRVNNVSQSLKNLDPTLPSSPSSSPQVDKGRRDSSSDSGASSPKSAADSKIVAEHEEQTTTGDPSICDPSCPCQKVLLTASPAACGLCGGRLEILSSLNNDRMRALDDLEIATQRINELAHEKARHVDYIADLETRVSEQAKKMDIQRDTIAGLKGDLSAMNDKFVDQVNTTAEIAHSRELVEAELEDLTQKLFTEANTMVADEKKARVEAEKTSAHLRKIIADLEERLSNETMQSQELKGRIEQMSTEYDDLIIKRTFAESSHRNSIGSHMSDMALSGIGAGTESGARQNSSTDSGGADSNHSDGFKLAIHTAASMAGLKSSAHYTSVVAGDSHKNAAASIRLDDVLMSEFKQFAAQVQSNRSINYSNLPYMKSVVTEDIEPCLRFGPRPRISSRNVLEAVASNRMQIEEMTPQKAEEMRRQQQLAERTDGHRRAMLWERFSGTVAANPNGCQACGREGSCTYRFRMGVKADAEWIQVDTFCRDRLVAACEFYGFVRYLCQGIFASRSVTDLYMETIRLRLCMFYARIGAYGYALDIDPALNDPSLLSRNAGLAALPDSPSAFNRMSPSALVANSNSASPIVAPYLHSGRTGSVMSVPMIDTNGGMLPATTAQANSADTGGSGKLASSSLAPLPPIVAANRMRSASQVVRSQSRQQHTTVTEGTTSLDMETIRSVSSTVDEEPVDSQTTSNKQQVQE